MTNDAIAIYLANREEFYGALLPRIPYAELRLKLKTAVEPLVSPPEVQNQAGAPCSPVAEDFLEALALRDVAKKRGFGTAFGRTAISFEEALARAEFVEETGALLFAECAAGTQEDVLDREAKVRRATLAALLRVEDNLRYRKA